MTKSFQLFHQLILRMSECMCQTDGRRLTSAARPLKSSQVEFIVSTKLINCTTQNYTMPIEVFQVSMHGRLVFSYSSLLNEAMVVVIRIPLLKPQCCQSCVELPGST